MSPSGLVSTLAACASVLAASAGGRQAAHTSAPAAVTLTVTITGARSAAGELGVAVFADPAGFPEDEAKALRRLVTSVDPATAGARVTFPGLPAGTYAVAVRHDVNRNGRLDKNFLGIPTEGYGVSNNPPPRLRSPRFDEAAFTIGADHAITIALIHR